LAVAGVLSAVAFLLVLQFNWLTIKLSFFALAVTIVYPFSKRFFALPQAILGVAFGFGIPMAFAAQLDQVPNMAWWLLLANVFWAIAYDTEYAMVDREDDRKIGIRTSAILFGRFDVIAVMASYAAFLLTLAGIGLKFGVGWYYWLGLAASGVLVIWQYRMIRTRNPDDCFRAFRHNSWIGAAVFVGILAHFHLPALH
jgi:4-hydroxybenzoate polyprenyltransferase